MARTRWLALPLLVISLASWIRSDLDRRSLIFQPRSTAMDSSSTTRNPVRFIPCFSSAITRLKMSWPRLTVVLSSSSATTRTGTPLYWVWADVAAQPPSIAATATIVARGRVKVALESWSMVGCLLRFECSFLCSRLVPPRRWKSQNEFFSSRGWRRPAAAARRGSRPRPRRADPTLP